MFAQCASIETFEHSANGRFLSTDGFGHNGVDKGDWQVAYNDVTQPYSQIDDVTFNPEGGHLHNWRPYQIGDPYSDKLAGQQPTVNSAYRETVTRFVTDVTGWDYFVGGYAYGNVNYGYVVYLGGHSYADCSNSLPSDANIHPMEFEFDKNISDEEFELLVEYTVSGISSSTTVNFSAGDLTDSAGSPLLIDLNTASVDNKKLKTVTFKNEGALQLTIDHITFTWTGGQNGQDLKKIKDKFDDEEYYNSHADSGEELAMTDFTIDAAPSMGAGPPPTTATARRKTSAPSATCSTPCSTSNT